MYLTPASFRKKVQFLRNLLISQTKHMLCALSFECPYPTFRHRDIKENIENFVHLSFA